MHPVLHAALSAMHDRFVWKERAHAHLGGPPPVVPRRGQAEIGLWCARLIEPAIARDRIERYRDVLARVEEHLRAPDDDTRKRARDLFRLRPPDDDPEVMAHIALWGVEHIVGDPRNASRSARVAVAQTVRFLGRANALKPAEFLHALDDRLMRLELEAGIARRVKRDRPKIRAVVYRGGDSLGRPSVWVAELESDSRSESWWGTLVRRDGFHFSAGSLEEALAVVPDDHFENAADAAHGRSPAKAPDHPP